MLFLPMPKEQGTGDQTRNSCALLTTAMPTLTKELLSRDDKASTCMVNDSARGLEIMSSEVESLGRLSVMVLVWRGMI